MREQLLRVVGGGATMTAASECFEGIFDNDFVLVDQVEEYAPIFTMRSSQARCAELQKQQSVKVFNPFDNSTKDYRIRQLQHDGTGLTRVILGA